MQDGFYYRRFDAGWILLTVGLMRDGLEDWKYRVQTFFDREARTDEII